MPTPAVEFHFDFGSPNAYLCHKVIPAVTARTGVSFKYLPVLLGGVFKLTGNQSPMSAFKAIKNKPEYNMLEMKRFITKYRIPFKMNPHFPINTVQIMRGAVAADLDGNLPAYADAVFHHMWEDPKKMDDAEVIKAALDSSGLDGARYLARGQDQDVKDALLKNTEASVARGTFGSPTFFVDGDIFFGKDRLRDVEDEIVARSKA
jgi:2-hydroxychromene-2-carboxylate isomerase